MFVYSAEGRLSLTDTNSKGTEPTASVLVSSVLNSVSFHEDAIHSAVCDNQGIMCLCCIHYAVYLFIT